MLKKFFLIKKCVQVMIRNGRLIKKNKRNQSKNHLLQRKHKRNPRQRVKQEAKRIEQMTHTKVVRNTKVRQIQRKVLLVAPTQVQRTNLAIKKVILLAKHIIKRKKTIIQIVKPKQMTRTMIKKKRWKNCYIAMPIVLLVVHVFENPFYLTKS